VREPKRRLARDLTEAASPVDNVIVDEGLVLPEYTVAGAVSDAVSDLVAVFEVFSKAALCAKGANDQLVRRSADELSLDPIVGFRLSFDTAGRA
jgi:hypothetical protein